MSLDITKIGTKQCIPRVGFYIRRDSNIIHTGAGRAFVLLGSQSYETTNYFSMPLDTEPFDVDRWYHMSFPIGPYYNLDQSCKAEWLQTALPIWTDIDRVGFWCTATADGAGIVYVDGLYFQGVVCRAAYDSAKIASQKCNIKLVVDDVPKDDSLIATDDSGEIAQFCKAELYRAVTQPIIGQIMIPMKETMKAGQLCHIHFGKKSDGSFNIDKDMRIIEVHHNFTAQGALSYLTLTDDVTNSHPTQPIDAYKAILDAVAPGFQDRVRASLIAKDVDLDLVILEKSYSTP